jgi:hypothetical protein
MTPQAESFWQKIYKRISSIKRGFIAELYLIAVDVGAAGLDGSDSTQRLKQACRRHPIGKSQSDTLVSKAITEGLAEGKLSAKPENKIHVSDDPWTTRIAKMPPELIYTSRDGRELVTSAAVLAHVLEIPRIEQRSFMGRRLRRAMEEMGWKRLPCGRVKIDGRPHRGYWRFASPR